ncbi:hypothetical protein FXB41_02975 [Bradyrhizobium canariense]|nr:hypothetical protein [Bradyrhizobium canariense]
MMRSALGSAIAVLIVAGTPPIRAEKVRYYEDRRLTERAVALAHHRERTDGQHLKRSGRRRFQTRC